MSLFPSRLPRIEYHDESGCVPLRENYFSMSNVCMPGHEEVKGKVVVVAGRPRIDGKSVLSHKLLHQHEENDKLIAIDLPVPDDDAEAGGVSWLRSAIEEASRANILDWKLAESIRAMTNSVRMSKSFNSALRQRGCDVIIRIPWYDASLGIGDDMSPGIVQDIIACARFARNLSGSFFVYECAYRKEDELETLQEGLDRAGFDNAFFMTVPPLLAADAALFVDKRQSSSDPNLGTKVSAAARQALERLVPAASFCLEVGIDKFCGIMHRACSRAEANDSWDSLAGYIIEEYEAYLKYRRATGESSRD